MKRIIVVLLLAFLLLSGCAKGQAVLIDTPTCTITREGATIALYSAEAGEAYSFITRRVRVEKGKQLPVRVLVDSGAFYVCSGGGVLWITDRATGREYIITR